MIKDVIGFIGYIITTVVLVGILYFVGFTSLAITVGVLLFSLPFPILFILFIFDLVSEFYENIVFFGYPAILALLLVAFMLYGCNSSPTEPFVPDSMYCETYKEYCVDNEPYCGLDFDGNKCECDFDLVGHPYPIRDCKVYKY